MFKDHLASQCCIFIFRVATTPAGIFHQSDDIEMGLRSRDTSNWPIPVPYRRDPPVTNMPIPTPYTQDQHGTNKPIQTLYRPHAIDMRSFTPSHYIHDQQDTMWPIPGQYKAGNNPMSRPNEPGNIPGQFKEGKRHNMSRLNEPGNMPKPGQYKKGNRHMSRLNEPGNMAKPGQYKEGKRRMSRLNELGNMPKPGQHKEGKRHMSRLSEPGNMHKPGQYKDGKRRMSRLNQSGADWSLPLLYRPHQTGSHWHTGMYVPEYRADASEDQDTHHRLSIPNKRVERSSVTFPW